MASSRALLSPLLLIFTLLLSSNAVVGAAASTVTEMGFAKGINKLARRSLLATIDCGVACRGRCSASSRPNLCKRACGSCCARCNCVPSGTSGNYQQCPCYASLTTHGGKKKCP